MSPQQAQGEELDGRSDQYALGCILYEMLSGVVPFDHRRNVAKVLMGHITGRVVPLSERLPPGTIPPTLDALVLRLLAKFPDQRFASMAEVGAALGQELKVLNPTAEVDAPSSVRMAPVRKPPGLGPRVRRVLIFLPLGLCLLGGGAYLGYRALKRPPDQALMARELVELRQRALTVLKEQLKSPEPELRLRVITSLGESHEPAMRALLEPLLKDPDVRVQSRAAEALGQLGERGAVAELRAVADRTKSPLLRVAAAGALDQLGDPLSQKLLHNALVSDEPEARLQAALQLCSASEVEAQNVLRDWLRRGTPSDEVFINTLYRLASAGDGQARSQLLSRLERGGRPEVQLSAAASLAKLGEERGRVVLREAAGRKDQTQVLAARLLASVEASTNVELFLQILNNPRATAAALIAASEGLADAGQSDDARALAGLLGHTDARLRQTAASAIVELTGRDPAALSEQSLAWAEGALSDRSSEIRSSAVATLGESTTKTVPLLQKVLTGDIEPTVRRAAARALARRQERDALTALHLGLNDTDADVRKETLRAIERIGERLRRRGDTAVLAEVKSWLTPLLNGPSLEEQVLASGTLYQLGDELQRSRLAKWLTSADAAIRRLALEQLARDRELLAAVLVDLAPTVRLTAARKLAELGDRRGTDVLVEMMARGGLDGLSAYALLRKLGVPTLPPKDLNQLRFDANPRTRRAALDALSALPPGELRPLLLTAVRDRAPEVRLRGAELAAELPVDADNLPGGLPVLRTLLYDGDIVVRTRASALLSRLLRPIAEKEIAASTAARQQPRPPVAPQVPAGGPRPAGAPLNGGPNSGPNGGPDGGYPDGGYPDGGYPDGGYPDGGYPDGGLPTDGGPPAGPGPTVPIEATPPPAETRLSALLVQQYLSGGVTALEHKDFAKAQKLLERAGSLCAKKGKRWKECAQLAPEITWRLGSGYEAQGQLANAAAEYQKLLPPVAKGKGKSERLKAAQAAIHRLSERLGRIEISKPVDGRCEQAILWMDPGVHRVSLGNGQNKLVSVQAGQTTEVKTCTASARGHHSAETP